MKYKMYRRKNVVTVKYVFDQDDIKLLRSRLGISPLSIPIIKHVEDVIRLEFIDEKTAREFVRRNKERLGMAPEVAVSSPYYPLLLSDASKKLGLTSWER